MKNIKVYAKQHVEGMAIYVSKGKETMLVTIHRKNNRLFFYLCDEGKTLYEMKSYKPGRNTLDQRFGRSLSFLIRQTELALEDLAA